MDQAKNNLEKVIELYRLMTHTRWVKSEIIGDVELTEDSFQLIQYLDENSLIYPTIQINESIITISQLNYDQYKNRIVELTLQPPRLNEVYFFENLKDLFSISKFKINEPKIYFIADHDFYNLTGNPQKEIKYYQDKIKLISIIKNVADFFEDNDFDSRAILLSKSKLNLPIIYDELNLSELKEIENLFLELSTSPHIDKKKEIFKSTLFESLINIKEAERFIYLIKCFETIYSRFKDNYILYLSEFSFDKIKEEVIEKKVKYFNELNKVVSEIQNKILAIPVAILLVSSQMSKSETDYLNNFMLLLGSYIFTCLMYFLITNQLATLEEIKRTIDRTGKSYEEKYPTLFQNFGNDFLQLESRYKIQKRILRIIWAFSISSLIFSFLLFFLFI